MTDMPPLAGGGGYTINLEDKRRQHCYTDTATTISLLLMSTGWGCDVFYLGRSCRRRFYGSPAKIILFF